MLSIQPFFRFAQVFNQNRILRSVIQYFQSPFRQSIYLDQNKNKYFPFHQFEFDVNKLKQLKNCNC